MNKTMNKLNNETMTNESLNKISKEMVTQTSKGVKSPLPNKPYKKAQPKKVYGKTAVLNEIITTHFQPTEPNKKISYRFKIEKNKQIVLSDSDKKHGLDLFCYSKCDNSSSSQIKRARGLVFCGEDLILKTFPYTDEYSLEDHEAMSNFVNPLFTQEKNTTNRARFFKSYEGSLIRVFFHLGTWFISTHRKLNAFKSKWASGTSFGEMFRDAIAFWFQDSMINDKPVTIDNALEYLFTRLKENRSYMFLVLPTHDNRVVCKASDHPTVYHVGTYENLPSTIFMLDDNIGIPHPEEYKISNFAQLEQIVRKVDPTKYQGVIIFGPRKQLIKVVHPQYFYLFNLRGNEQSIKFQYLKIRCDESKLKDYENLYPEYVSEFKEYERCLDQIAKDISNAYRMRYINREKVVLPQEEFQVLRKCREWYLENTKQNRINPRIVAECMNFEEPTALNKMIKRLKMEERQNKTEVENKELVEMTEELNLGPFPILGS